MLFMWRRALLLVVVENRCLTERRARHVSAGWNWNQLEPKPGVGVFVSLLKTWWPGTESNRRRQPFQGCLPTLLSGSDSTQISWKGSYWRIALGLIRIN